MTGIRAVPSVLATVTLLPQLEHGRRPNEGRYMPHIVIGDPQQRESQVGPGGTITEHYLGVLVTDAPDEWSPGETADLTLRLMYWPEERYEGVVPGATFTVREGPSIVGFGKVLASFASPVSSGSATVHPTDQPDKAEHDA